MRCTQIIGVSKEARSFLKENAISCEIYADAKEKGMFNDGPELLEYTLKNGEKIKEIIQAIIWSSGPCIFLSLENEKREKLFIWTDEELNNA